MTKGWSIMSQWTHIAGTIRIDTIDHDGVRSQINKVL